MKQIEIIKTYSQKRCLVVDDVPDIRASLKRTLIDFGSTEVDTAGNAEEAIDLCRKHQYDIVLADYNLGSARNGQQLLEELRYNQLLKNTALFVMITAETAGYRVLHALEYQPDDYLNKPISRESLRPRLDLALLRNEALIKVKEALDERRINKAIGACQSVIEEGGKFQNDARKMLGELLCSEHKYSEALGVYDQLPLNKQPLWAKLGIAKAMAGIKEFAQAETILKKIIHGNNLCIEAYDLLAKIYESQHKLSLAQHNLEKAINMSPISTVRQRELGRIAESAGDLNASIHAYRAAVKHSKNSSLEDPEDYINLANGLTRLAVTKPSEASKLAEEAMEQVKYLEKKYSKHPVIHAHSKLVSANIYQLREEPEKADQAVEQARSISETFKISTIEDSPVSLCINCAKAFMAHGKYDEGEALLQKIAEVNEDPQLAIEIDKLLREPVTKEGIQFAAKLNKQGIEQYQNGNLEEAIRAFQAVLLELPNHVGLNLNLIQALISKNKEHPLSEKEIALIESGFQRMGELKANSDYTKRYLYLQKKYQKIAKE